MSRFYILLQVAMFLATRGQEQSDTKESLQSKLTEMSKTSCPAIVPQVFMSHVPSGGIDDTTMNYTKALVKDELECVSKCCESGDCQVAFMFKNNIELDCFLLNCARDDLCLPRDVSDKPKYRNHARLVLVTPKNPPWNISIKDEDRSKVCEVGMEKLQCKQNETCVPLQNKSRNGVCRCASGFILDATTKKCVAPVPVTTRSPKESLESKLMEMSKTSCPAIVPQVFMSHVPSGGIDETTMNYTEALVKDEVECVSKCCESGDCQVAFMFKNNTELDCFLLNCARDDLCLPIDVSDKPKYRNHASLVLVTPKNPSWNISIKDENRSKVCEVGMEKIQCKQNETCVPMQDKLRNGICRCASGFILNATPLLYVREIQMKII